MEKKSIHQAIVDIMRECEAISKTHKNQQQGYNFRGIDDVYNSLNPLLAKHGVFSVPEVLEERREEKPSKSGGVLTSTILKMRYTIFASDGSSVQTVVIGEGMDSGDKSANKAMAVAHKYALLQIFAIPTEDPKDPENDSPEPVATQTVASDIPPAFQPPPPDRDKLIYEDEKCPFGKYSKGKRFGDIATKELRGAAEWAKKNASEKFADFIQKAEAHLAERETGGMPF